MAKARKRKTSARKAGARVRAMRDVKALGLKPSVHVHEGVKCSGSTHHASCNGRGPEVLCQQVSVLHHKFAICTHV